MNSLRRFLVFGFASLLTISSAYGDVLSTAAPNNGSGGVFFDLTASGSSPLTFNGFATYFGSATVGTPATVEVWSRPGSYVGFQVASTGWTLVDTVVGTAAGTTVLSADINLTNPIFLAQSTTTGFYIHSITTGNGIRYTGTGASPPQTTWSDSNITLFGAHARTGAVSFGSTVFTPRTFAGNINYSAVPEPASAGIVALIGLATFCRRRSRA